MKQRQQYETETAAVETVSRQHPETQCTETAAARTEIELLDQMKRQH
jgi:chaperonin cofactor prefoldin